MNNGRPLFDVSEVGNYKELPMNNSQISILCLPVLVLQPMTKMKKKEKEKKKKKRNALVARFQVRVWRRIAPKK